MVVAAALIMIGVFGAFVLTDLDSSNGVFLNGQRTPRSQPIPLSGGDRIDLGGTGDVALVFEATALVTP